MRIVYNEVLKFGELIRHELKKEVEATDDVHTKLILVTVISAIINAENILLQTAILESDTSSNGQKH